MRFAGYNFLRLRRNLAPLFFTTILPVFFYLLFGTLMDVGSLPIHTGKFAALQMISMALYGGGAGAVGGAGAEGILARGGGENRADDGGQSEDAQNIGVQVVRNFQK